MMARLHLRVGIFMPLLLALACNADDPTQIVVLVDTDLAVPGELDRFRLQVEFRGQAHADHTYPLTPGSAGAASLPGTFTVVAGEDLASLVTVEVTGQKGSNVVVRRTARTRFSEGEALLLRLTLQRACVSKSCPKGQTCKAGLCASDEVDPATLPRYSPDKVLLDGGPRDAGAGPDLAPDKGPVKPDHRIPDGPRPPDKAPPDRTPPDKTPPDLNKCGNGKVDGPGEQCDGKDLAGKTCMSMGKTGGQLTCSPACKLITTGCYRLVDGDGFVVTSAAGDQIRPALASDGTRALVMWEDTRNSGYRDTYAQMVDPAGKLLLPSDLLVLVTNGQQNGVTAVYDGGGFLGVWSHFVSGANIRDLRGATISVQGKLVKAPIDIIAGPGRMQDADMDTDGSTHYLAWRGDPAVSGAYTIYGARVSKAPKSMDGLGVVLCASSRSPEQPRVAVGGGRALVVYAVKDTGKTHSDVVATMVNMSTGTVLGAQGFALASVAGNQSAPDVAFDGKRFLVVWVDDRNGTATDLYGSFITTAGVVQPAGGMAVTKTSSTDITPRLSYGSKAGRYLLVHGSTPPGGTLGMGISGVLLDQTTVLTPGGFNISNYAGAQSYPDVTALSTGFFVAWEDDTTLTSKDDIRGARVLF